MELRSLVCMLASIMLSLVMGFYGAKFLKKRNYLLGIEWLIIGVSGANFAFYWITLSETSYAIMLYLDAFSRLFGIPVIGILGMMAVSHHYRPSISIDAWVFLVSVIGTAILLYTEFFEAFLPYIYLVMWYGFAAYLCYFAVRLFSTGQAVVAVHLSLAIVASTIVHTAYDFYAIPGDDTNVIFNFWFIALVVWSYLFAVIYYAYIALGEAPVETDRIADLG
ncbi:MAG: hypothetical protein ACU84Q_10655 [Gammaproteobacteria bacterium]